MPQVDVCQELRYNGIEVITMPARTHGMSNKSGEYASWLNIRQRCFNPNNHKWHRYGGRGITVDPSWESFEQFYADMGPKPSPKHSIDRIDNDGPYAPWNCRWADTRTQRLNRDHLDVVAILADFAAGMGPTEVAKKYGISQPYASRLKHGKRGGYYAAG